MPVEGEARRRRSGSGWRYTIGGEPVDSVSTVVREGVPARNLIGWAGRTVADYALDHWAELHEQKPSERHEALRGAPWAERDAAANRGTEVHKLAEQLARGDEVEVPEAIVGHVDAYLSFAEQYDPDDLYVERTVIYRGSSLASSYMGTSDLWARIDGELWLLDWKTGGSGIWPEVALQLAAYAHAQTMLDDDGHEVPAPAVDKAAAVWLRADGYDVYPLDISDATFRVFQYAQQLARFKAADREQYVAAALDPRARAAAS